MPEAGIEIPMGVSREVGLLLSSASIKGPFPYPLLPVKSFPALLHSLPPDKFYLHSQPLDPDAYRPPG